MCNALDKKSLLEIEKCSSFCTYDFTPLCAQNKYGFQKTLINKCFLKQLNCLENSNYTIISEGNCKSETNICPIPGCFLADSPICAINSEGIQETYDSDCHLKSNNCEAQEVFQFLHAGKCKDDEKSSIVNANYKCEEICSRDYSPICAENSAGNQFFFSHECIMRQINCANNTDYKVLYAGQCKNQVKNCPELCMASYQPVCARNALGVKKTFGNACTLSVANCLESIDFVILKDGECDK